MIILAALLTGITVGYIINDLIRAINIKQQTTKRKNRTMGDNEDFINEQIDIITQTVIEQANDPEYIETVIRPFMASYHNRERVEVTLEGLKSRSRVTELASARQLIIYFVILDPEIEISWGKLSAKFNRTHATAIHAVRQVKNFIENEDELVYPLYVNCVKALTKKEAA